MYYTQQIHRKSSNLFFGVLFSTLSLSSLSPLAVAEGQSSLPAQHCDQYASVQNAVLAAGNYYNPLSISEDRQYIGAVLQDPSGTHFIYTAAAGKPGADKVQASLKIPAGYELAAFWQTRGVEHWGQDYFTAEQTQLARQWQLPYYMTNASGDLKVFQPEDNVMSSVQARHKGLGQVAGVAMGSKLWGQQQPLQVATRLDEWQAQLAATAAGPDSSTQGNTAAAGPACIESL